MPRYLFGPTTPEFARGKLSQPRAAGDCLAFDASGETDLQIEPNASWAEIAERLPAGWEPDFIAVWAAYGIVPAGVWDAPVPVVLIAGDWNLLWHLYREAARHCELVLADTAGVDVFSRAGFHHARHAILYGCGLDDLEGTTDGPRDIDILFVGNLNAAVQPDRMPWLGRVARLADRFRVVIQTGVYGAEYRRLLRRARVVFNRSIRGECNQRAFEAAAAGALVFQEAGNRESPSVFTDRRECVYYNRDDLIPLLTHYLRQESERAAIASAARDLVHRYRFDRVWNQVVAGLDLVALAHRRGRRTTHQRDRALIRALELLNTGHQRRTAPYLVDSLKVIAAADPSMCHLLGLLSPPKDAIGHFSRAAELSLDYGPANLGLAEALAALDRTTEAVRIARAALDHPGPAEPWGMTIGYPPRYDRFRYEWERAGWHHADDPSAESSTKADLLRWRLHYRLAIWTGDAAEARAAARLHPDITDGLVLLGRVLARAGQSAEAVTQFKTAFDRNPFDPSVSRALIESLDHAGSSDEAARYRADVNLLGRAAPGVYTQEWDSRPPATRSGKGRRIVWEGGYHGPHSYARVNRAICEQLIRRGNEVQVIPTDAPQPPSGPPPGPIDVWVRHRWPPVFSTPPAGQFVLIQPWEFGSLPSAWAREARAAREVWAYSRVVRDCYLSAGFTADRVPVIPLGVDPVRFRPGAEAVRLPTMKRVKFLFVGGTIPRKGIDLLLAAYGRAFTAADDVCLVVKDIGGNSFYAGQTAESLMAQFRDRPDAPELLHLVDPLPDDAMPGLYAACDCLVHPFRGEGFGLPIAEAMACGRPVVVTGVSPATDFVDEATAYLVPAERFEWSNDRVGNLETVGRPWQFEPDVGTLADALLAVVRDPRTAAAKGRNAADRIRAGWTWDHTARAIEERIDKITG